jgi:hypothetical protein
VSVSTEDVRVSRHLIAAIKLSSDPAYRIARKANLTSSQLSKLLHGAERVRPQDPRVLAVAAAVGVAPERAFARTRVRA